MPEVLNRTKKEREVAKVLQQCRDSKRKRLEAMMGDPPSLQNVPPEFWEELEECERASLLPLLALLFLGGAKSLQRDVGVDPFDEETLEELANKHAERRAKKIARQSVVNTRKIIRTGIRQFRDKKNQDVTEPSQTLDVAFGRDRADLAGVTEVTGGNSSGERMVIDELKKEAEVTVLWRTERDAKVCPICTPLEGKPESKWARLFPEGPPAHVNCRCWLDVVLGSFTAQRGFRKGQ